MVVAPPGSGKTTRVPPALLDDRPDQRVLVLQPRRVAARLAAARIAYERGGRLGGEVGYRTRFERQVGRDTRLEVLTEGLLLRRLQADPFLDGVGAVVLDEFHERSLNIDLALALLAEVQREARHDLRVVVMSATLDPEPVRAFLGGPERCGVTRVDGRLFPVERSFDARPSRLRLADRVAAAVRQELERQDAPGHVLVFLPGVGEIRATADLLERDPERALPSDVSVHPLHGALPAGAQDAALAPGPGRKVVLATNIAETSITLDGVRTVIDSGMARIPRWDLAAGVQHLELQRIPRSSADQRAGRAGRTGPGRCRRLWTEAEDQQLSPAHVPEIRRADLSPVVLQLRAWGTDPATFGWFEAPSDDALAAAEALLVALGAVDGGGITALGRALASLPVHPRSGTVLLAGAHLGLLATAATTAALLEGRDILRRDATDGDHDDDLALRLQIVAGLEGGGRAPRGVDRGAVNEVRRVRDQLLRAVQRLQVPPVASPLASSSALPLDRALLAGYPDRVAAPRGGGDRLLLASGTGARIAPNAGGRGAPLVLALGLRAAGRGSEPLADLVVPLDPEDLVATEEIALAFDADREAVTQRRLRRVGAVILSDLPVAGPADPAAVAACLLEAALAAGIDRVLDLDRDADELLGRVATLRAVRPDLELPDLSDPASLLPAVCVGRRSFEQLRRAPVAVIARGLLDWRQISALDRLAPERLAVPSGSTVRLAYDRTGALPPVLAARVQQLFGMMDTPRIAEGRIGLVVHLLAPNNRPAQVTADLASFWANTYPEVRKDLRGRYPRHSWPEDPRTAIPEDRPKRRR